MLKRIILCLVAGILGGLLNSLGVWGAGALGISTTLGFHMTPDLTLPWLAPRLIQGGLWGLLFLLPFWKSAYFKKGAALALCQAVVMLVVIFPRMGMGMYGVNLGAAAVPFVLLFTQLWGVSAAGFLKATK